VSTGPSFELRSRIAHCELDNRQHGETIRTINFPHTVQRQRVLAELSSFVLFRFDLEPDCLRWQVQMRNVVQENVTQSAYGLAVRFVHQCSPTNVSETKAESLLVRQRTKTAEIISSSGQLSAGKVEEDSRSGVIVASSPILATFLSAC
jgi:hypothetical protein